MQEPKYRRILIKLSGEQIKGTDEVVSYDMLDYLAKEIESVLRHGVEVSIVIGGGNIWRGSQSIARGMDTAQSHYMGMLGTIINGLALQDALERRGQHTRTMTAIQMNEVAEPYIRRRASRHMEKGRVIILAGGTGNPYFTTDSAAALRAAELHANIIMMAKNGVDGIYSADPRRDPDAVKLEHVTYMDALNDPRITVMDSTALTFCMDNDIPIIVFNALDAGTMERIVMGERVGTMVSKSP